MTHTVVGLFDDKSEARAAMTELVENGFMRENIDLSNRAAAAGGSGADLRSDSIFGTANTSRRDSDDDSIGDRIANFFNGLFGDDRDEAEKYSTAASDAQAILTIQTDSKERAERAAEILDRHDAIDVDERADEVRSRTATTGAASGAAASQTGQSGTFDDDRDADRNIISGERPGTTGKHVDIPVAEENVQVGKREVERGGIRIRSRIVERPIEERIRLREEHVIVDRHPVDREISGRELDNFNEGEFEIVEHAEEPVVSKQAHVTEEVSIGKEINEREEVIRDNVRSTDVDVEPLDDEHTRSKGANR